MSDWVNIGMSCWVRASEVVAVERYCGVREDDGPRNYGAGWLTSKSVVELRCGKRLASPFKPGTLVRRLAGAL